MTKDGKQVHEVEIDLSKCGSCGVSGHILRYALDHDLLDDDRLFKDNAFKIRLIPFERSIRDRNLAACLNDVMTLHEKLPDAEIEFDESFTEVLGPRSNIVEDVLMARGA